MGLIREAKRRLRLARARAELTRRRRTPPVARPHGLPWPLVVSLTSYPARFGTLVDALDGLLLQDVAADATILWLAPGDADALPPEVRAMQSRGLTVATAPDWRSYKKLVPARLAHPDAAIVTADDDLVTGPGWLGELVAAAQAGEVAARRAHRVAMAAPGQPAPYEDWRKNLRTPERGPLVFPTGGTGVLYPPGSLHPDTADPSLFGTLAPTSDDVWFWWMHRLARSVANKIGVGVRILEWPGSQTANLRMGNLGPGAGNDQAITALLRRYGWPVGPDGASSG